MTGNEVAAVLERAAERKASRPNLQVTTALMLVTSNSAEYAPAYHLAEYVAWILHQETTHQLNHAAALAVLREAARRAMAGEGAE